MSLFKEAEPPQILIFTWDSPQHRHLICFLRGTWTFECKLPGAAMPSQILDLDGVEDSTDQLAEHGWELRTSLG